MIAGPSRIAFFILMELPVGAVYNIPATPAKSLTVNF